MEIVDDVIIPADITPGEWVLGWRWVRRCSTRRTLHAGRSTGGGRGSFFNADVRVCKLNIDGFIDVSKDAEESHQIWQSCSDITIVAA